MPLDDGQPAYRCEVISASPAAYLTCVWELGVKSNDGEYYGYESRHTRERVDLPKAKISLRSWGGRRNPKEITDPYCPTVWATTIENAPFIVKSSDEFPTGDEA
jgi:hypothetical protein